MKGIEPSSLAWEAKALPLSYTRNLELNSLRWQQAQVTLRQTPTAFSRPSTAPAALAALFYKLKARYGGMDLSDAKRLKQLEDENAKLKRLVADVMLDNVVLKDLLGKP